jgi:AcrR family transcriptional regulator
VVKEAADVADEVGWEHLTLATVADRLGVRLPSLYKHIDSLDGLRRDVGLVALGELRAALAAAAVGRAGADALRAMSAAYRAYGRSHPGRYAATVRAPAAGDVERQAAAEAVLEIVFAVLAGYGLTGDDAIDATRVLRAGLHGFVTLESGGGFGLPRDVDHSYECLIDSLDQSFAGWSARAEALAQ